MTARLIDTHAHLTYPPLAEELGLVLARARAAGVSPIFTVGTRPEDNQAAVAMAEQYEDVFAIIGLHPHEADTFADAQSLKPLLTHPKVLALGETGLDYHYTFATRENQRRLFQAHLELAAAVNRPVVVHCREAFDDCLAILKSAPAGLRGVFHCFSGDESQARKVLDLGWLISFSGTVTFKTAHDLRRVARFVGLEHILTETDCPFLSPEPVRKNRTNEPANILHIATRLADLFGRPLEEFARPVRENAARLFGQPLC